MSFPELLSPAGAPESVRAAVQAGAGAVYMGYGSFNARRSAKGFSQDEMAEAIAYCRARGVKTNITLNILTTDRELSGALNDAKFLYEAGADALIVQDLGLASLLRRHAPDLDLHASTQMTVHTLDGAREAKELGFSRVVLSRECSLDEVSLITENAGVETEVFVHGALCMCYSGQCYLSAVIGRRSGNRGLCAQPCRLPMSGGYPLSLKDLSLADHVCELKKLGVCSLKIEGRMKRPEYTYIVTAIYAALLRENRAPTEAERDTLRRVFSRDGFTDGYLTGEKGDAMFGTKTEVPLHEVQSLYDEAASRFAQGREAPLVPVALRFSAAESGISLSVEDGTHGAAAVDLDEVPRAINRPATVETVEKALRKTGGTPFYAEKLEIDLPEGLMLSAARLNALRREALEKLMARRLAPPERRWQDAAAPLSMDKQQPFAGFTASVRTGEQARALAELGLTAIYAPLAVAAETGLPAILPRVFSDREQPEIERLLGSAMEKGTDTVMIGNLGQLALARRLGLTVCGDFGLNAFNSETLAVLAARGVSRQTLSFELRQAQLRDLCGPLETEMIVYGFLPLMVFENCAIRRRHGGKCACKNGVTELTDRKGQKFALLPEFGCRNTLLNSRALCWDEPPARAGVTYGRLLFTVESPETCARIARSFVAGEAPAGEFTRGLYHRGVE
ncbi:U32 family peptidase [Butyricicoccus faecihominis]|uniref:U32 family peptidase n=1 Tax=Butyricicoccus faecihominis TaxID=1712515 RepID=UPI00247883E6|nr:U32 family peptidase [Butyricicoccus faecihominis]MCQ5129219.1 U32 family peptidase [Butyricicoccus faecihominis]